MKQKKPQGKSKYAIKRRSGKMMYGPGCCGHKHKSKTEEVMPLMEAA